MFSLIPGEWCKQHTKNGTCADCITCGKFHNPTCHNWEHQDDGYNCGMGQRCAFPHRYEVKAKCPKGTTADADGKMILPSKASAKPSTAAVLQVRLADAPWNGRDDDD